MDEAAPGATEDRLGRLVKARLEACVTEAERRGGRLSVEAQLEAQALAALLDVRDRLRPAAPRRRWPVALAFALALTMASALLFLRVPETEIELEATVSEVSFRLTAAQALTEVAQLRFVAIAGIDTVDSTSPRDAMPGQDRRPADSLALYADAADARCQGSLTLDRMILPRDAQVGLRRPGSSPRIQMLVKAPGAALQLTVAGCVRVGGAASAPWTVGAARALPLRLGSDEVDIDLESAPGTRIGLAPFVRAHDLSLTRIEQVAGDGAMLVRRVSTVAGGTVYFQSLDGQQRKLRFAEPLRFARSEGEFRSIDFDGGRIDLRFHGDVRDMHSGSETHARSWMPSWLDWLKANHSLTLFWAAAMSAFGLVAALLKWWKTGA